MRPRGRRLLVLELELRDVPEREAATAEILRGDRKFARWCWPHIRGEPSVQSLTAFTRSFSRV